ncbi:MAG: SagB/ThcOx family dehydrogenase [Ignisphaera sp.]|nr:SagB/ThcOx family dehydrogenase [Ignisphaera sp.]MCX8168338.1 SagB/ThcOx family dehydrogenase [Ignisphaera sp.]MDW8085329.1 SagB/ThcOx family dehydrogenase [Ignisphaera sp.]
MSIIALPTPQKLTYLTVEEAILLRRSIREFKRDPIKLTHISMILWAAYGITDPARGFRASPSAGATYPLELYLAIGEQGVHVLEDKYLESGVYKYIPSVHGLSEARRGDVRRSLMRAALNQKWIEDAPVSIVITAIYERTTRHYGERGRIRYVPIDVGHVGQNIYLMSTALGYGTVAIGAFRDSEVASIVGLKSDEVPIYIMPIGVPERVVTTSFNDLKLHIDRARQNLGIQF